MAAYRQRNESEKEEHMSSGGSNKAIVAALGANLGIATTKFVAAGVSGSASMFAEAIHSLADSGNQILLIVGGKRSRREATENHPFGYGRSRYIYAFLVSIVLFSIGGMFSIMEGISKLQEPHELEQAWLPLTVLGVSIVLESFSLRTALKEVSHEKGDKSLIQYIRHAKAPELPVVVLEDIAALVGLVLAFGGVGLTVLTHNPMWDAIGTLAIGALLVLVALVLGAETSSLLVGEGASPANVQQIREALERGPGVESVIHLKTLYLGPEELMLGAKIAVNPKASAQEIAQIIDDAEAAVRSELPEVRVIYLEPDILRG
jgi:cation diffusion facilitator family transporter